MVVPSARGPESLARPHDDRTGLAAPEPVVFGPTDVDPTALTALTANQLEVTTAESGSSTTVRVRGELLQESVTRFIDAVSRLGDDAAVVELVVDLSGTTFLDSTGLGSLVSLRNQVLARGGRFAVVRPEDRVFRLFELTRLDTVFEFVDAG